MVMATNLCVKEGPILAKAAKEISGLLQLEVQISSGSELNESEHALSAEQGCTRPGI